MQTLKLCRRGEPGISCHVKSAKDRREVDATLIVHGCMRLRTEKGTKVADKLLHLSSYRVLNNIHTEHWSVVGWTTRKRCLSVFVLFCWRHAYVQKIPGSPHDTYSRSGRAWERGYPDHTFTRRKGSGDYRVLTWLCRVSSINSEQANEAAQRHTSVDANK